MSNNKEEDNVNKIDDIEIIEFISNNYEKIWDSIKNIFKHIIGIWKSIPDLIYDGTNAVYIVLYKIIVKIRLNILFKMTQDMNRLKFYKEVWTKLTSLEYDCIEKKLCDNTVSDRENEIINLMLNYLRNNKESKFLSFCIENQNNKTFKNLLDNILNNDIENNYTNFGLNPYKISNIDDNMDNIYDANELDDISGSDELATIISEMDENNMSFKIVRPKVGDILENDV
jgi:hypothetical protein